MAGARTGVYANAKADLLAGTLSFLSAGIKALPVRASYTQDFDNDEFLSDIPSGARAANPVLVTGKQVVKIQETVVFKANAVAFPSVAAGAPIVGLVLYEDTGTAGSSRLIGYFDYFSNLPITPVGANITFNWPVYGVIVLLEGVLGGPQGVPGDGSNTLARGGLTKDTNTVVGPWFDIRDYGAVPSSVVSGSPFDCTAAFKAAIHAAAISKDSNAVRTGVVYVPPAPDGYEWYVAGEINDNYGPMPHIEVARGVVIKGTGASGNITGGSRIKCGPFCTGFRTVGIQGSSDGGDATSAAFEDLAIFGTSIDALVTAGTLELGWKSNHAYTKGKRILPHRMHALYFECLKNGTSTGPTPGIGDCSQFAVTGYFNGAQPTGNRWRPGKAYSIGDKIYPNTQCGKTFRCSIAGHTNGVNFGAGPASGETVAEGLVDTGQQPNVGEPDWFTDLADPVGSTRTVTEAASGGLTWVVDDDDPEPMWDFQTGAPCIADFFKPSHAYTNGAWVFGPNLDRIFVAHLATPTTDPQMSGASVPAGWATAKYATEEGFTTGDDIVVAGGITWRCVFPYNMVFDGGTVWAARAASAYAIYTVNCHISRPYVQDFPSGGIAVYSLVTPGQSQFGDFLSVRGPGQINGCGNAIYASGGDANACHFEDLLLLGRSGSVWGDTADHCIDDRSFLGNHYSNIVIQGCSGWAIGTRGSAQSGTIKGLYLEGYGRKSPVAGGTQISGAGTAGTSAFRLGGIHTNSSLSVGGPSSFPDGMTQVKTVSTSLQDTRMQITATMSSSIDSVYGMSAKNYLSPGTADDIAGYSWKYQIYGGWWSFINSEALPCFSVSGSQEGLYGPSHIWLHRGYRVGLSNPHFEFGDPTDFANVFTAGSVRGIGDTYHRSNGIELTPVRGTYAKGMVLNDGKKVGEPWATGLTVAVGDIVTPTKGHQTLNHRSFRVTTAGTITSGTQPTWNDTLAGTTNELAGTVVYTTIEGVDVGFTGLIEDGFTGYTPQTAAQWKDTPDTDARTAAPKTSIRGRRGQKQTTTSSAQALDDGVQNSVVLAQDLTCPNNGVTEVSVLLTLKQNGTAEGGTIKLSGSFYRDAGGDCVRIGTDDNNAKLSSGVAGVTAALVIAHAAIELRVTPGSTITLDWGWTRIHTEGTS